MTDCMKAAPLRCGGPTKARRERRKAAWRRTCHATHGRSYERCQLLLHRPLPRVCSQVLSLDKLVPKSACQPHDALLPDYVPCVNRVRHELPVQEHMARSGDEATTSHDRMQDEVGFVEETQPFDGGDCGPGGADEQEMGMDFVKEMIAASQKASIEAIGGIVLKKMSAIDERITEVEAASTNEYHSVSTQIDQMKHAQMEENKKLKQMIDDAQQQIKLLKEESKAAPEAFTGQLAVMTTALGFLGVDDIKSFRTVSKEWSRAAADLISCYRSPRAVSMEAVHKSPSTKQVASPASVVFLMKHRDWKLKRYMFNRQRCEICERIVCWPDKFLSTVFCGTCFQDAVDSGMLDFRDIFEDKPDNFASFLEDLRSDCGECPPWCTCQLCQ